MNLRIRILVKLIQRLATERDDAVRTLEVLQQSVAARGFAIADRNWAEIPEDLRMQLLGAPYLPGLEPARQTSQGVAA